MPMQWLAWPHRGEHRTFWSVAGLLAISAAVQALTEVQATSLLADTEGTYGVLLLWAVEALVTWVGIAAVAPWLDRVAPKRIAVVVAALLALAMLLVGLGARAQPAPGWWVLLGLLNGVQADLLVLAGWTLARHAWTEEQGARLFGLLSALAFAGTVLGGSAAALAAGAVPGWALVLTCGALLALVVPLGAWGLDGPKPEPEPEPEQEPNPEPEPGAPRNAARWMWQSPLFRRLALLQLGTGAAWTALSLVTVLALQLDSTGEASLQRAYGGLKTAAPLLNALIQGTLASAALRRFGYGPTLLTAPVWLTVGLALLVWWPAAAAAWLASLGLQAAFGLEGAALQVVVLRADSDVRGRVGAILTGQLPQLGYVLGCAVLALAYGAVQELDPQNVAQLLALCGLALALANVLAARGLRALVRGTVGVPQPKQ